MKRFAALCVLATGQYIWVCTWAQNAAVAGWIIGEHYNVIEVVEQ